MKESTLSPRELNRALLARQLLLERSRAPLVTAVEQMGGIQAQYAPSAYIGLWTRLERFALQDLTRALEQKRVVQATLMRITIHIVSASDYPLFAAGTRAARREAWLRYHRGRVSEAEVKKAARVVRRALANGPLRREELGGLIQESALWNGVSNWLDLVRVPPSGTWERRRADLFGLADEWVGPSGATEAEGVDQLLRRYLRAFGPARVADAADWAGLPAAKLASAAERLPLRTFRDEEGKELLDLPRAPRPEAKTLAPPRFLPIWDATLLVHARRTHILPERFRALVFSTKTPQSISTFLVDGAVAGSWRVERTGKKATLRLEPFEGLPAKERASLEREGERLLRLVEPEAESYAVSGGGRASRRRAR